MNRKGIKVRIQTVFGVSTTKGNFLLANPDNNPRNLPSERTDAVIRIDGQDIKETGTVRLLGVNIDDWPHFSGHINDACKKVSQQIGVVIRLRNLIPCSAKLLLFIIKFRYNARADWLKQRALSEYRCKM